MAKPDLYPDEYTHSLQLACQDLQAQGYRRLALAASSELDGLGLAYDIANQVDLEAIEQHPDYPEALRASSHWGGRPETATILPLIDQDGFPALFRLPHLKTNIEAIIRSRSNIIVPTIDRPDVQGVTRLAIVSAWDGVPVYSYPLPDRSVNGLTSLDRV